MRVCWAVSSNKTFGLAGQGMSRFYQVSEPSNLFSVRNFIGGVRWCSNYREDHKSKWVSAIEAKDSEPPMNLVSVSKQGGEEMTKKKDWLPKPYTAIDFLKVTRQLFGLSLVEAKTLYDFLRQMTKDKQEDWI